MNSLFYCIFIIAGTLQVFIFTLHSHDKEPSWLVEQFPLPAVNFRRIISFLSNRIDLGHYPRAKLHLSPAPQFVICRFPTFRYPISCHDTLRLREKIKDISGS